MEFIHNPRCSKSRQTLDLLKEKGIEPAIRLYLDDTLSKDELKSILNKLNVEAASIIRKSEKDYKENLKGKELSEEQWIDAMIKFPILIQRPIVVKGNKAVIGRPIENVIELISE